MGREAWPVREEPDVSVRGGPEVSVRAGHEVSVRAGHEVSVRAVEELAFGFDMAVSFGSRAIVFPSPLSLGIRASRRQDRGYGLYRDKCPAGGSMSSMGACRPRGAVDLHGVVVPFCLRCSLPGGR
ncbi:hypothetical protein ART_4114 [Arthrobacter sp. PAMC 25486]|nr:hypothetical protein ART_4114 [Arthrobacter sp. PAMC 25486]